MNVILTTMYNGEIYNINMGHSLYINDTTIKGMDIMKASCVMMAIHNRQDALVDDRLCGKERG